MKWLVSNHRPLYIIAKEISNKGGSYNNSDQAVPCENAKIERLSLPLPCPSCSKSKAKLSLTHYEDPTCPVLWLCFLIPWVIRATAKWKGFRYLKKKRNHILVIITEGQGSTEKKRPRGHPAATTKTESSARSEPGARIKEGTAGRGDSSQKHTAQLRGVSERPGSKQIQQWGDQSNPALSYPHTRFLLYTAISSAKSKANADPPVKEERGLSTLYNTLQLTTRCLAQCPKWEKVPN